MQVQNGDAKAAIRALRLLLVDDDQNLCGTLARGLNEAGLTTTTANGAAQAREILKTTAFDLMLVDVMMPCEDGWELVEGLRRAGDATPVIFLTARDAVSERVRGLRLGADDYIIKPFDFSELVARIDAVLRRRLTPRSLKLGPLEIHTDRRYIQLDGQRMELSPREFDLLAELARATPKVLSRQQLLRDIWGIEFDPGTNNVDVHVARLRRRLGPKHAHLLETVVGQGYRMVLQPEKP